MSFSKIFTQLRNEKNISISRLSEELNISRFAIMKWERNETFPNMEAQKKICKYFNVSSDYLLGIDNNRSLQGDIINDPFIIKLSLYSSELTEEQKTLIIELAKQATILNKNK